MIFQMRKKLKIKVMKCIGLYKMNKIESLIKLKVTIYSIFIYLEVEIMRNKVKAMSRMMKMLKTLRQENESVVQLKGICPDGKVPKGLLLQGSEAL